MIVLYRAKYDINDEISPIGKTYTNMHGITITGISRIESTHGGQYGKWERNTPHQAYKCGTRPLF